MVPSRHEEVCPGCVCVYDLVFGPIKYSVVHGQHSSYSEDLVRAFVPKISMGVILGVNDLSLYYALPLPVMFLYDSQCDIL